MIKIVSADEVDQMKQLPVLIQESIRNFFIAIEEAADIRLKDTTVFVVERQSELAHMQEFGLEHRAVLPEFIRDEPCGDGNKYTAISMRIEDKERITFYIPSEFLERSKEGDVR